MKNKYDVVIIGSGIAGMTAAIYLTRAKVNVLLLDKEAPGGQLLKASKIENYPGFTSIEGYELATNIYNQIVNLKIDFKISEVLDIEKHNEYNIITNDGKIETKFVVIATGRLPKKLGVPNEQKYLKKGLSWCAVCDGNLYKDEDVCIIGDNKKTIEEALYLKDICKKVTIISSSPMNELTGIDNINGKIIKLIGDQQLEALEMDNGETIKTKALFINDESLKDLGFLKNLNIETKKNYIVVNEKYETTEKNIYACGDIIKKDLYQLVTAANDGALVATNIKKRMS